MEVRIILIGSFFACLGFAIYLSAQPKPDLVTCENRLAAAIGNLQQDKMMAVEREAQLNADIQRAQIKIQGLELELEEAKKLKSNEKEAQ